MNLPFFKNFNKKVLPSYFLVLVLRDEKAQALILEELAGKIKIVGSREEYFSSLIDELSPEEFLQSLDKAISHAESSLPENIQTQKTIFGVKDSWTENDQIKKEYLGKLKKASEELGLTPIGFLVISQAIVHLLAKEEGAPISAILAEINKKTATVTLVKAGKIIETKSSEIHESVPFTVDAVLKHFDIPEILPSRIIIFNGNEDLSQEFITHTWSKSLPFLHLPQITNLPQGFDAKAVLFGAATQMGFAVLEKDISKEPEAIEAFTENPPVVKHHEPAPKEITYRNIAADNFGFAKDIDVAKLPASPASLRGVQRGEPVPQMEELQESARGLPNEEETGQEIIPEIKTDEAHVRPRSSNGFDNILMLMKNILITILSAIFILAKKLNIGNIWRKIPQGRMTIIIPSILFLIIALIMSYFLFLKATIEITVDPKITEKTQAVLFSAKAKTDSNKNVINGEFVTVSQDGNVSTAATGKKDVGENAKGSITILSSLSGETTIKESTIVKSSNGLEFTLDNSVKMASSSGLDDLKSNKANVTANDIGKEYNLPSGAKFTVGSFDNSQLVAKNDNPFSGGTKKEVTVVSKNDQDKLETDLSKQLENKARENLIKQVDQDKILLPVFVSNSISKKNMSAKVGDETNQVTLTGTVEYQGFSYDKSDLIAFSKSLLEKNVPKAQEINYNNIKTSVKDVMTKDNEEVEASLNIKALLLPKIDQDKLIQGVKGKSFKYAEDTLYKLPQVSNVKIVLSPKIPFLPKSLPLGKDNIKILIKING